jgi:hypothetical protein
VRPGTLRRAVARAARAPPVSSAHAFPVPPPRPSRVSVSVPVLVLPAALVDPAWLGTAARERAAAAPAWARLSRRASIARERGPEGGPIDDPGHERWWRERLALPRDTALAAASAHADGVPGADWRLDVVHLHVGRDHLVLTDPAALPAPDPDDLRELAASVAAPFADDGLALEAAAGGRWYLRETDPSRPLRLLTRPLAGALGRNVDAWMPTGDDARRWRRLVNEVQMTWHAHPANERREAAGLAPLNSLWIEGRVPRGAGAEPRIAAAARLAVRDRTGAGAAIAIDDGAGEVVLDETLLQAQLEGDPRRWLDAWTALDAGTFADVAAADGHWRTGARIVLCGDAGWRELSVSPQADWRFWRHSDPAAALAEPRSSVDGPPAGPAR